MKRRQTGSAVNGASTSWFLKNQDCPKTPLCNISTHTDVNHSTAGAEEPLYSYFFKKANHYPNIFEIFLALICLS